MAHLTALGNQLARLMLDGGHMFRAFPIPARVVALAGLVACQLACGAGERPRQDAGDLDAGGADAGDDAGAADAGADAGRQAFDAGPFTLAFRASDGGPTTSEIYARAFSVRVSGAEPGALVHLTARAFEFVGKGSFVAAVDGTIDTGRDAPVSGTYRGVDVDGLLWSAEDSPLPPPAGFDVVVTATSGDAGATATLARPAMGTGFTLRDVSAGGLPAKFLTRPDAGARGAVLVLGGSDCSLNATLFEAAWVSTMGFDALAVDYCDQGFIERIPLERLEAALDWLGAQQDIDRGRLAVLGGSRGGELALQLAADLPWLRGAVAVAPSSYRWSDTRTGDSAAWTRADAGLASIPRRPQEQPVPEFLPDGQTGYRFTPVFLGELAAASGAERSAARIAVEDAGAAVLMIGGDDDGLWPSCRFIDDAWNALADAGHQRTHPLDRKLCVPGAGHLIGAPGYPTADGYSMARPGVVLVLGGTAEGRGHANRAADEAIRAFLQAALAP